MGKDIASGVWPAVLTCLDENRRPSQENITKLVELLVSQKVGGLYVLGSTGQGPAMNVAVRKEVMAMTSKANAGRLPIMTHVGAVSPHESIELAKHAADHGADAISSVPPIYFTPNAEIMFNHYRVIASATDLPFYPYHFQVAGMPALDEYVKRLLELPNIKGMKITDNNLFIIEMVVAYAKGKLQIFSGCDELILPAVMAGADGAIGSFYNMFAPAVIKAREAFLAGDIQKGKHFMLTFSRIVFELIKDSSSVYSFFRTSMRLKYGIDIGPGITSTSLITRELDDAKVLATFDELDKAAGL